MKLSDDIIIYHFEANKKQLLSTNIVLIKDGSQALLIDTGYKRYFQEIESELRGLNLTLSTIVVSHFHPDHIGGLEENSKCNIYGNILAKKTLEMFPSRYDHLLPNIVVIDKKELIFGTHRLQLLANKGHSVDGLLVEIDKQILFVGDDLIYTDQFKPVLPFCADHNIVNHIASLEKIDTLAPGKIIIPSHGLPIKDTLFIQQDIANRSTYLNYILANKTASYNDFVTATGIKFVAEESHHYNIKKIA